MSSARNELTFRSAPVLQRLSAELERGALRAVGLAPLVLNHSDLRHLLKRRSYLYDALHIKRQDALLLIEFKKHVRRTRAHPNGRLVEGSFYSMQPDRDIAVLVSDQNSYAYGPLPLLERSYPLAQQPYVHFRDLIPLMRAFADEIGATLTTLKAVAYSERKETDIAFQKISPEECLDDFSSRKRTIDRMKVSFRKDVSNGLGDELYRVSFDRRLSMKVNIGEVTKIANGILAPALLQAIGKTKKYEISVAEDVHEQQALELTFARKTFSSFEDMSALCDAIRGGEGLSVSVIHLNPLLQAQVIDFLSGDLLDLIVLDDSRVSIVPQNAGSVAAIRRVTSRINTRFKEARSEEQARIGAVES